MSSLKPIAVAISLLGIPAPRATGLDLPDLIRRGKLMVILSGDPAVPDARARLIGAPNDQVVGLEGEILLGFARLKKLELELVYVARWEELIPVLLAKKGDLIAGGFTDTTSRRETIDFTVETFPTRNVVITRRPHRVVQTIEQLREERVGIETETSYAETVRAAAVPEKNIKLFGRGDSLDKAMRAGAITATVEGVETVLARQADDPDIQQGVFLGPPQSLAIGVRKEDRQQQLALNEYISAVRKTPTWNRLVVKYFGERAIEVLRRARGE